MHLHIPKSKDPALSLIFVPGVTAQSVFEDLSSCPFEMHELSVVCRQCVASSCFRCCLAQRRVSSPMGALATKDAIDELLWSYRLGITNPW